MKKAPATSQYGLCLAAVCLLLCGCLLAGVAQARYSSSTEKEFKFKADALQSLRLLPLEGGETEDTADAWRLAEDGSYYRTFSLRNYDGSEGAETNIATEDLVGEVYLLTGLGIEKPEALTVTLTLHEWVAVTAETVETTTVDKPTVYRGIATAIGEGTALWYRFGEGWCWHFYEVTETKDADGSIKETVSAAPVTWSFVGNTAQQYELTVSVTAEAQSAYSGYLQVCAAAVDD